MGATARSPYPIGQAFRLLGDRWAILILGVGRFDGFLKRSGISRTALTSSLECWSK